MACEMNASEFLASIQELAYLTAQNGAGEAPLRLMEVSPDFFLGQFKTYLLCFTLMARHNHHARGTARLFTEKV